MSEAVTRSPSTMEPHRLAEERELKAFLRPLVDKAWEGFSEAFRASTAGACAKRLLTTGRCWANVRERSV